MAIVNDPVMCPWVGSGKGCTLFNSYSVADGSNATSSPLL